MTLPVGKAVGRRPVRKRHQIASGGFLPLGRARQDEASQPTRADKHVEDRKRMSWRMSVRLPTSDKPLRMREADAAMVR